MSARVPLARRKVTPMSSGRHVQRSRARVVGRFIARRELVQMMLLLGIAALCAWLHFAFPATVPISLMMLPLSLGSLWLSPRMLPWFVVSMMGLTLIGLSGQRMWELPVFFRVGIVFGLGVIIMLMSFRRSRLGVGGVRGEEMFVDLRDRINRQSQLPELSQEWTLEYAHRSAGGTPFSGDFAVGFQKGDLLQLAVVDVSGKGLDAGTRALLLAGAMGGLMGALPAGRFLAESNDYLCRQDWTEGFATAVHVVVDLRTGQFELRSAGHPPAVHLVSGSGRWLLRETEGPALGLVEGVEFEPFRGRLDHADVVLLYTDGLVESSTKELSMGIDKLLGTAEKELRGEVHGRAEMLVNQLGSRDDDTALLLLRRA